MPLIIADPRYGGGRTCQAVTSHVDIAPTLVALTGVDLQRRAVITKDLPGKDLSGLLSNPQSIRLDDVRSGALFNFNMLAYLDGDFLWKAVKHIKQGGDPKKLKEAGINPDLGKRGAVRSVFDGRYVFSRYFSPKQHNRPETLAALYQFNDVELFDMQADPLQMTNIAADRQHSADLVMAMNEKLNDLIDAEVGEDRGQMLPGGVEAGWEVTAETMAP